MIFRLSTCPEMLTNCLCRLFAGVSLLLLNYISSLQRDHFCIYFYLSFWIFSMYNFKKATIKMENKDNNARSKEFQNNIKYDNK